MISPSQDGKDSPSSTLGTGSLRGVDLVNATSDPLTSLCASSLLEDDVAVKKQGLDRHGSLPACAKSPSLGRRSISSASLDADDEADALSPSNPLDLVVAMSPSSVPVLKLGDSHSHRTSRDRYGVSHPASLDEAAEVAQGCPTRDIENCVQQESAGYTGDGGSLAHSHAPLQTAGLRRCRCRSSPSRSARIDQERGNASLHSSPAVPLEDFLFLSSEGCGKSVEPTSGATSRDFGEGTAATRNPARSVVSDDSARLPLTTCMHEDSDGVTSGSGTSSPPILPLSLTTPAAKSAVESSIKRISDEPASPLAASLRLSPWAGERLQHFGCCVFFFPAPFVSWLFPLVGHVAISNAEGSRLYTFESSYYVREEKLSAVLDRVLCGKAQTLGTASSRQGSPKSEGHVELSKFFPRPAELSPSLEKSEKGDASVAEATLTSSLHVGAVSPPQSSVKSPASPRSSGRPLRRGGRQRSAAVIPTSGHAHTQCVRIWDLKPLLMESRGRRTRRTPHGFTTQGGRQAAAVLWERLQELLQSTEVATSSSHSVATASAAANTPSSLNLPRSSESGLYTSVYHSDDVDGVCFAPSMSSSSGEEEGRQSYELLDAETARFFNRNLHATIRLFRGSADGSINSPDVVLQHHSSFSFVGFVLEACGVGSQKRQSTPVPALRSPSAETVVAGSAAEGSGGATGRTGAASAGDDVVSGEGSNCEEEIHWGVIKLLFHVSVFGQWHRGERRLWRVVHGGSITGASMLWVLIIALAYHYFKLLFC